VDWIENLVNSVTQPSIERDLGHLVAFPTRHSLSVHYADAANWARNQLNALNYTTRLQNITVSGSRSWNVIADKRGNATGPHQVVLITAHLDSINNQGGPTAPAPGADDNGSGSAGLLEIARAFSAHRG
jgi:Zn-dependent M28 family amino/carboxypeptidase